MSLKICLYTLLILLGNSVFAASPVITDMNNRPLASCYSGANLAMRLLCRNTKTATLGGYHIAFTKDGDVGVAIFMSDKIELIVESTGRLMFVNTSSGTGRNYRASFCLEGSASVHGYVWRDNMIKLDEGLSKACLDTSLRTGE